MAAACVAGDDDVRGLLQEEKPEEEEKPEGEAESEGEDPYAVVHN
jgi:hypothetical protein